MSVIQHLDNGEISVFIDINDIKDLDKNIIPESGYFSLKTAEYTGMKVKKEGVDLEYYEGLKRTCYTINVGKHCEHRYHNNEVDINRKHSIDICYKLVILHILPFNKYVTSFDYISQDYIHNYKDITNPEYIKGIQISEQEFNDFKQLYIKVYNNHIEYRRNIIIEIYNKDYKKLLFDKEFVSYPINYNDINKSDLIESDRKDTNDTYKKVIYSTAKNMSIL